MSPHHTTYLTIFHDRGGSAHITAANKLTYIDGFRSNQLIEMLWAVQYGYIARRGGTLALTPKGLDFVTHLKNKPTKISP
jgi:hypothetical protein